ncbi:unnamed protein product [Prorocentrum cordatum]|uniref:TerD domain-containing protein n=1 Tax=Prorocentrum cordatum TaxID=2364126 RepID=A0ABN9VT31_9DINO|nr:unnamed protein product [Polarella glacialis]
MVASGGIAVRSVLDLQDSNHMTLVRAGLGWDVDPKAGDVDLDVSVVLFAQGGKEIGAVFFGNLAEFGVEHRRRSLARQEKIPASGDNLTGEGAGDDEVMMAARQEVEGAEDLARELRGLESADSQQGYASSEAQTRYHTLVYPGTSYGAQCWTSQASQVTSQSAIAEAMGAEATTSEAIKIPHAPSDEVSQGKDAQTPSTAEARTQPVRDFRT